MPSKPPAHTLTLLILTLSAAVALAGCTDTPPGTPEAPEDPIEPSDPPPNPPDAPDEPSEPSDPADPPPEDEPTDFPPGIYHLAPPTSGGGSADLVHLNNSLSSSFEVFPVGYDIRSDLLIYTDSQRHLHLVSPNGDERRVELQDVHSIGRPSLSPDGRHAAIQALEGDAQIGTPSEDLNIYIVDLETGSTERVSHLPWNEESPVWVPGSRVVAYSSFNPEQGVDIHLVDVDTGEEVRTIPDVGELHLRASKDGTMLVQGPELLVFSVSSGEVVADLLQPALDGLRAAGYEPTATRGGSPDLSGFPLAADFSPDGSELVIDGAVTRDGEEGIVVVRMGLDGSGFEVLTGLIPTDASFDNDNNFSQVDPRWV